MSVQVLPFLKGDNHWKVLRLHRLRKLCCIETLADITKSRKVVDVRGCVRDDPFVASNDAS